MTASAKYDVYGAKRSGGTGTASSRQGFVGALGHVTDTETGLVYMRARYYDPNVGRFVSEDPAGNGVNWFAYCGDNPTNEIDQTGKAPSWGSLLLIGLELADQWGVFQNCEQVKHALEAIAASKAFAELFDGFTESSEELMALDAEAEGISSASPEERSKKEAYNYACVGGMGIAAATAIYQLALLTYMIEPDAGGASE